MGEAWGGASCRSRGGFGSATQFGGVAEHEVGVEAPRLADQELGLQQRSVSIPRAIAFHEDARRRHSQPFAFRHMRRHLVSLSVWQAARLTLGGDRAANLVYGAVYGFAFLGPFGLRGGSLTGAHHSDTVVEGTLGLSLRGSRAGEVLRAPAFCAVCERAFPPVG